MKLQKRSISFEKLSNKRITRLSTDIELDPDARLINRNPRNLEQLAFEYKPAGFWLDRCPVQHRATLVFSEESDHLHAALTHWSGRKLVRASTSEPFMAKYFRNPCTTQAASVLAQVISRRCLQSGYLWAGADEEVRASGGPKTKVFFDTVESNGLQLMEPPVVEPRQVRDL